MPQPPQQSIEVAQGADVSAARQAAKEMARELGFGEKVREEIAIAVSELAWNLAKHARRGKLTLTPLQEAGRVGIEIESIDSGPGIPQVEQAMTDGFSTAGGLGCGLGAVNRLMDEFYITSRPGTRAGTRIVCRRWMYFDTPIVVSCPLDFGAATRPHPMRTVNGDAFIIERWGGTALVGVIDGLGHGQFAHQAAEAARHYVESHLNQPLKAIFRSVERACRATHGVVMALARLDWARATLAFASVGNVEARLLGTPQRANFVVRRGIVGLNAPDPAVTEHGWGAASVLVLHSDGLMTNWRWEDFAYLDGAPATVVARQLLQRLARDDDDATVVVMRAAPGGRYKADGKSGAWRTFRSIGRLRGDVVNGDDLKRQLAMSHQAICALQGELEATNSGLIALTLELEQRVDERTVELRAAHEELQRSNSELVLLTLELEERVAQRTEQIRKLNGELGQRVAQRTAELAAANKELEAFAYSVSHDLRAPLRHIDGFAKLLALECAPQLDPNGRHYLERICEGTRQMGGLVDDLLTFSRLGRQEVRWQLTSLNSLVEEVLRQVKSEPRTTAIPVVVLTSSKEERDMVESYQLGVNSYIQKPVDFDQFRETVKQLGLCWLVVNEPPPPNAFKARETHRVPRG